MEWIAQPITAVIMFLLWYFTRPRSINSRWKKYGEMKKGGWLSDKDYDELIEKLRKEREDQIFKK